MTKSTLIKFPVTTFKKIETPQGSPYENVVTYIALVNIKDLSGDLKEWRTLNVRDPKLTSGVSKKIKQSLIDQPALFVFKNRGITLIAASATYDNKNGWLELELSDPKMHGLLDGGHTYGVIQEYLSEMDEDSKKEMENAFVRLEILVNIESIDDVVQIVEARNTSTQVKEQSIAELEKKFAGIKEVLGGMEYSGRIAYKEYELAEDDSPKDIDIKDIISYLVCFDIETYSSDNANQPLIAYTQKTKTIEKFSTDYNRYVKYIPLLPKVLELRDVIYKELPQAYNKNGGKFGGLKGVTEVSNSRMNPIQLKYIGEDSHYRIPSGFIYPILAAFRNLVTFDERTGSAIRKIDPVLFYQDIKEELAIRIGEPAKEFKNPNKLGKDTSTRRACSDAVKIALFNKGYQ